MNTLEKELNIGDRILVTVKRGGALQARPGILTGPMNFNSQQHEPIAYVRFDGCRSSQVFHASKIQKQP